MPIITPSLQMLSEPARQITVNRFWARFTENGPNDCWPWMGSKWHFGHGRLYSFGLDFRAHRLSYELFEGDIPAGLCVCHHCDNPGCVNPNHLYLGDKTQNTADRDRRGRTSKGERHYAARLSAEDVRAIRAEYAPGRGAQLARRYGVSAEHVMAIVKRKKWRSLE